MQSITASKLQKCTLEQVQLLQDLAIQTYQETFAESNSEALLQKYYQASLNLPLLSSQLQNDESEFYFIYSSENDKQQNIPAGFLKLNIGAAQTDIFDPDALEVEKIYILNNAIGKGLGREMIDFAIERAKQQQKQYLWLGVWEHNYSALAFYKKMGFTQFSQHNFDMGGDIQIDLLLKRDCELKA